MRSTTNHHARALWVMWVWLTFTTAAATVAVAAPRIGPGDNAPIALSPAALAEAEKPST